MSACFLLSVCVSFASRSGHDSLRERTGTDGRRSACKPAKIKVAKKLLNIIFVLRPKVRASKYLHEASHNPHCDGPSMGLFPLRLNVGGSTCSHAATHTPHSGGPKIVESLFV